jgi:hypothetical protein
LYTAGGSAGSFRVIATQQGGTRADTSAITITVPAPTLTAVEVSPTTATVGAGTTQQFTAIGRMSDNSTTSIAVTWSATGGSISSGGLYSAGGTAGSFRVIATQQGGSLADTSVVTLTAPPPPGTAIVLTAHRLASGSGTTLISAGVPLQPGQLQPGNVSGAGLWRNGSEVAASITALEGRYADGSVISLLVQYDAGTMTKGTAVPGYELRFTGSSVARTGQNAAAIKDVPDGVWALPPAHFKAAVAPVYGPLLPLSETTGTWAAVDADWAHAADTRWESCGEQVTGTEANLSPNVEYTSSKYDQPKNRIIYWARGGDIKNLERGLRQVAVSRNYQATWQQWNNQDVLSMSMAYWWTGVASYRARVLSVAQGAGMNEWMGPPSNPGYDEGRITARNMGWAMQAWLLGYGSSMLGNYTALQWLDGLAQRQVTAQATSGTTQNGRSAVGAWFEYERDAGGFSTYGGFPGPTQSNFMAALRAYYLSLYMEYRGPSQVAGISAAIRRNADFLMTQYDGTARTWHYWSDWTNGDAQVGLADMRNLALLHTMAYYRAYHDGFGSQYLTQANEALTAFAANVPNTVQPEACGQSWSLKVFTESYYLYPHAMAMANGL